MDFAFCFWSFCGLKQKKEKATDAEKSKKIIVINSNRLLQQQKTTSESEDENPELIHIKPGKMKSSGSVF